MRASLERIISGLALFLNPHEAPVNFVLVMRYLWNTYAHRKHLVVLVREGGIGDMACLLASVPGLRDRHPNSWLVVITPRGCRELVASSTLPDAVAEANGFFHRLVERSCDRSAYYQPYLPDEYKPARPQILHLIHEFARELCVRPDPSSVHFRATSRVRRRLQQQLHEINRNGRPVIVLHPGPTWPVREWPLQRWCELADLVRARTSAIMIKIGTDLDSMRRSRPVPPIPHTADWTNGLSVIETVALLEQASAFVGIDSGPLHLAGVLGTPSVGLFGPISGNLRIYPGSKTVIVTGAEDCLGCHHRPTGPLHWRTGCPHNISCMQDITAERVLGALLGLCSALEGQCAPRILC
jgi:ADP-heptose:LPS heptosyltransferase